MKKRNVFAAMGALLVALLVMLPGCTREQGAAGQTTGTGTLAKTWREFSRHHELQIACFEMGWTGPEKDKDFVTPEIEQRTNLLLKYEPVTVATEDDVNQKLNLMVASGDLPEVYFGGAENYDFEMYDKMGEAGLVWDIAGPIAGYKNIAKLLEPELIFYRHKGGKANYCIPTQTGRGGDLIHNPPQGLYLRDDLLKKLGMSYPTTPEEVETYLRRCRDEIKTIAGRPIIGWTCDEGFAGIEYAFTFPHFPIYTGQFAGSGLTFDVPDNCRVVNYLYTDSPELMRAAKYVSRLYREGLIDREILTQKRAQYEEKISTGRVVAFNGDSWVMNSLSENAKAVVPELLYVAPPPIEDKANGVPRYPDQKWTAWIGCYSTLIISKKVDEQRMRHFLALLDYLATRDGQILVGVGIEGKSFNYNDQGKYVFTDDFKTKTDGLDFNKVAAYGVWYWAQLVSNSSAFADLSAEYAGLVREDNLKSWENYKSVWDRFDPEMKPDRSYYFRSGPVENEKLPAIDDAKNEMWVKVLRAKSDAEVEQVIRAWAETCRKLGIDSIIEERRAIVAGIKL
jgi:ABC-type glycerol-3-phosphate transport system substrate-binding protein